MGHGQGGEAARDRGDGMHSTAGLGSLGHQGGVHRLGEALQVVGDEADHGGGLDGVGLSQAQRQTRPGPEIAQVARVGAAGIVGNASFKNGADAFTGFGVERDDRRGFRSDQIAHDGSSFERPISVRYRTVEVMADARNNEAPGSGGASSFRSSGWC